MVPKGWSTKSLAEIVKEKISYGIVQAGPHIPDGVPYIKSSDVRGSIKPESLQRTSQVIHFKYRRSAVHPGDIVFSLRGNIGESSIVPDSLPVANLTQGTARISVSKEHCNQFYYYQLASEKILNRINALSKGSTFKEISLEELRKVKVLCAPLPEQKKIAQILSTWDQAISTTEQLLANSQQQKKALMQQLLTGKKRLGKSSSNCEFKRTRYGLTPKDWDYPAIKDICTQVNEKNTSATSFPVLSCSKYDGFVDSLKYFNKKVYSDDTSGYRLIHRGCFGFPSNHVEEGSIGLQNLYDTGVVSPIYEVFRALQDKVNNDFLYAILKTDHYRQIFGAATNASVDRRGSLRWKEFSLIHVPLPSLEEQQKIASVLSAAAQEITILQRKLDCLKQEKKALMQQLLTGKRRVTI